MRSEIKVSVGEVDLNIPGAPWVPVVLMFALLAAVSIFAIWHASGVSGSPPIYAGRSVGSPVVDWTQYVSQASNGRARLLEVFDGPEGVKGLLIQGTSQQGKVSLAWAPLDGRYMFMGTMLNRNGTMVGAEHLRKVSARIKSKEDRLAKKSTQDADPLLLSVNLLDPEQDSADVFVFYDPLCPHCKKLYDEIDENGLSKDFSIGWVPVSISENSFNLAALSVQTGEMSPKMGNVVKAAEPATEKIKMNTLTFLKLSGMDKKSGSQGSVSVPLLFWPTEKSWGILKGVPTIEKLRDIARGVRVLKSSSGLGGDARYKAPARSTSNMPGSDWTPGW